MRPATTVTAVILALLQQSPPDKPTVPARAEVLVLGVYHMSNPGHDIFNMQADDVLAPKRQAEITQVMAALQKIPAPKISLWRGPRGNPIFHVIPRPSARQARRSSQGRRLPSLR